MKLAILAGVISMLLAFSGASAAPFGSVPIQKPTTEVRTPGTAPSTPPQVRVGSGSARQVQQPPLPSQAGSGSAQPSVPQAPGSGTAQPPATVGGTKWVQDPRGARYQISAIATLPPGWTQIPPPARAPQPPIQMIPAPAPYYSQPQTYSGGQPPVNVPRAQVQPQMTYLRPTSPTAPGMPPPSATGLPPGKKRLRHTSGYTVIVSENAIPGPDFTEIESSSTLAVPQQMTTQPYTPIQPQPGVTYYSPGPVPQQPTYYQQPQTYNSAPPLSHLPPTWQQPLPYQPPQPQYQPPTPGQLYQQPMQQPAPLPVVRKTPRGKKWVTDQSGIAYLINEDVIVIPPMREVSEEELNRPVYLGPQPGQQQQGSRIGRFFQGLTGNR